MDISQTKGIVIKGFDLLWMIIRTISSYTDDCEKPGFKPWLFYFMLPDNLIGIRIFYPENRQKLQSHF